MTPPNTPAAAETRPDAAPSRNGANLSDRVRSLRLSDKTQGGGGSMRGMKVVVVSRTLKQEDNPDVTVLDDNFAAELTRIRAEPGKDIWLFGGGSLFRSLLEAGLVDTVEVAILPVLLGGGIPLLPPPVREARLKLTGHKVSKAGRVSLKYAVK